MPKVGSANVGPVRAEASGGATNGCGDWIGAMLGAAEDGIAGVPVMPWWKDAADLQARSMTSFNFPHLVSCLSSGLEVAVADVSKFESIAVESTGLTAWQFGSITTDLTGESMALDCVESIATELTDPPGVSSCTLEDAQVCPGSCC